LVNLKSVHLSPLALAVLAPLMAVAAGATSAPASLSAEQIVAKNIEARGGLQAWRAVRTMSYSGKVDAGGEENPQLPFTMELKRPRKTRLEIEFAHDTAIQVYDGANGWKLRPFLGRKDVEPYNAEELKSSAMESDLDGPLVDYASKGTRVELAGVDPVEGHDAYKLKLVLRGGQVRHLWIDAKTFLEVKIEGAPRRMDGKMHPVEIYYREFGPVSGLTVPHLLETKVLGLTPPRTRPKGKMRPNSYKMTIENVVLNPNLDDSRFTKPDLGVPGGTSKPSASF